MNLQFWVFFFHHITIEMVSLVRPKGELREWRKNHLIFKPGQAMESGWRWWWRGGLWEVESLKKYVIVQDKTHHEINVSFHRTINLIMSNIQLFSSSSSSVHFAISLFFPFVSSLQLFIITFTTLISVLFTGIQRIKKILSLSFPYSLTLSFHIFGLLGKLTIYGHSTFNFMFTFSTFISINNQHVNGHNLTC